MTLKGKRIFITGGAGFIGSHLVEVLGKTCDITVYDNFFSSVATPKQLYAMGASSVIRGDVLDQKKLKKSIKKADIVFHFAAACVRLSLTQERFVHDVNATGALNVLLAARDEEVERYIHISSSEVYGTAIKNLITEAHEKNPTTVYGMSKYIGELYAKNFNDMQGLPAVIIRPFNCYGPHGHFETFLGEVIPRFIVRALNGKQPIVFGSGKQTRDFTYVYNTVDGIIKAAQCDKLIGDHVNIAYGKEISVLEIARIVCKKTGLSFQPIMKPSRPHDVLRHAADTKKAKRILGYSPKINVEQGIALLVDWMKKTYPNPKKLLSQVPDKNW